MSKQFVFVNTDGDYEQGGSTFEESDFIGASVGGADAGKPVVLDPSGKIDSSMIDDSDIDHGLIGGLGDDDHTQYILVNGGRAFTGDQSLGNNKITNLADGVSNGDAVNKGQLDSAVSGLQDFRESVKDKDLLTPPGSPSVGDRYLIGQPTDTATGAWATHEGEIAEWNGSAWIFETQPNKGTFVFVEDEDSSYVFNSDTFASGMWVIFNSGVVTASFGLEKIGNDIRLDLLANGGLAITGNEVGLDFASNFTIDSADGKPFKASDLASSSANRGASTVGVQDVSNYYTASDLEGILNELESQIGGLTSSTFNFTENNVLTDDDVIYTALNKLDLRWGDLASNNASEGASLVGIEDSGANFSATNVEDALAELADNAALEGITYTVGTGGVTKGDLVYISANDTVVRYNPITNAQAVIGMAASTQSAGQTVKVLRNDIILDGFVGLLAGTKFFWTGSGHTSNFGSFASGSYIWLSGVAKNATNIHIEVEFIMKKA